MYWALYKLVSTGTWNLKVHLSFTSWGGKAVAFQTWSSSVTYTVTVMSRPARERHTQVNAGFLEALALTIHSAWKQLDDLSGTGMFFLQLRLKGLGKTNSVALFLSFWLCGKTSFLYGGPWEHTKRLLWTYWSYCKKHSDVTWLCRGTLVRI